MGGDAWNWISSNPAPFSGSLAHQSAIAAGLHQHYFYNATTPLPINSSDTLLAYVYLDPANVPSELMLQWNTGSWDWEHRAYWGTNAINYGIDGSPSRRNMGALPAAGQWVRLAVPASQVGLGGTTLYGMAFTLNGGRATWDYSGKVITNTPPPPPPADTNAPFVFINAPANNSVVSGGAVALTANASDNVGVSNIQFRVDGQNLGAPVASVPYTLNWDTRNTANGPHQLSAVAMDTSGNRGTSSIVNVIVSNSIPDVIWVEDALPAGATPGFDGGDSWTWVSSNPNPFSGTLASQSNIGAGSHQHFFYDATTTLAIGANDTLIACIYLDPANVPAEVMLQWNDGTWDHRAYWGANSIGYGTDGTAGRRYMGSLPPAGQWVRLSVPAGQVSLQGRTLNGMAFSLFGGRATWDYAGKAGSATNNPPPPPDTTAPSVSISAPSNNAQVSGNSVAVSANASDNVGVASVQFRLDGVNLGAVDTSAPYALTWDTRTSADGAHQLSAIAVDASGNRATSSIVNVTVSNSTPDTIWVEDRLPAGAVPGADGGDAWTWVAGNPAPYSGSFASQSSLNAGLHQHYFYAATTTLAIGSNDTLITYVYLDPANMPAEVMLQWNDGTWSHRAYWGANDITYGVNGTAGRRYMGNLPPAGQWVRLAVPASQVDLQGSTLNGIAFTLFAGRAAWDHSGKTGSVPNNPPPPPIDTSAPARPANTME